MGAVAMPAAMLGSSIIGGIASNKAAKNASKLSPSEQGALNEQTSGAAQQRTQASELYSKFMPYYQQAAGYYGTLLGGNRAALGQQMMPERQGINDAYAGAQTRLDRSGVQGGVRDQAIANMNREKAGRYATLLGSARSGAAGSLASMSSGAVNAGQSGLAGAMNTQGQISQTGLYNRAYGNQQGLAAGQSAADMIFQILKGIPGAGGKAGSKKTLPSTKLPGSVGYTYLPPVPASGDFG